MKMHKRQQAALRNWRLKYTLVQPLFFAFLVWALGACKVDRSAILEQNSLDLPPPISSVEDSLSADTDSLQPIPLDYHAFFADSQLTRLIEQALANNYDLKKAEQTILVHRGRILEQESWLSPQVDATAHAGAQKFGDYTSTGVGNYDTNFSENVDSKRQIPYPVTPGFFLGLKSSWEIDIWKKLRAQKKAAQLRMQSQQSARRAMQTIIVAEVAKLYYELLRLDYQLQVFERNIELQEVAVELISLQKSAGKVTELAVQQFRAQLLNTKSRRFVLKQKMVERENALNELLGRYPQKIKLGTPLPNQDIPEIVRKGIQPEYLLNRPDLQKLEKEVLASDEDVFIARTAFYPRLTLSGHVGFDSFKPHLVFSPYSLAANLFAGLSAPILNRKRIQAQLAVAQSKNKQAYFDYQQGIIQAYEEVLNNLSGLDNYEEARKLKELRVNELSAAVRTANELFLVGYASYLEVVTAQRNKLEAELDLAATREQQFKYFIELYRALGGGWKSEE